MVRLTDRPDMTITVDWEEQNQTKQTKEHQMCFSETISGQLTVKSMFNCIVLDKKV